MDWSNVITFVLGFLTFPTVMVSIAAAWDKWSARTGESSVTYRPYESVADHHRD